MPLFSFPPFPSPSGFICNVCIVQNSKRHGFVEHGIKKPHNVLHWLFSPTSSNLLMFSRLLCSTFLQSYLYARLYVDLQIQRDKTMTLYSRILKNCPKSSVMVSTGLKEYGRAGTQRQKWSNILISDHLLVSQDLNNLISFSKFKLFYQHLLPT